MQPFSTTISIKFLISKTHNPVDLIPKTINQIFHNHPKKTSSTPIKHHTQREYKLADLAIADINP